MSTHTHTHTAQPTSTGDNCQECGAPVVWDYDDNCWAHDWTEPIEITDSATIYYDDSSDPSNPGWVLRYDSSTQTHLDEQLFAHTAAEAVAEARSFLQLS